MTDYWKTIISCPTSTEVIQRAWEPTVGPDGSLLVRGPDINVCFAAKQWLSYRSFLFTEHDETTEQETS